MFSGKNSALSKKLPPAIIRLGLVSLLTDMSSEAIFPLLPAFLAALGSSNAFIGLIEGAANAVANAVKYFSGAWADRSQKSKPWVLFGYSLSMLARPFVAWASAPWHVLSVRLIDRFGKGMRTSPRDALIAYATPPFLHGRAYGFHRAMDHAGAALGTLLSLTLLALLGATQSGASIEQMRTVFKWAALPSVVAVLLLLQLKEPERTSEQIKTSRRSTSLPVPLKRALGPLVLFTLASASEAFILVKAHALGLSAFWAPVVWLGLHVVKASSAWLGGHLLDGYKKSTVLMGSWSLFALSWAAIGWTTSVPFWMVWVGIYGVTRGVEEGTERALVAELAGASGKGQAFGVYHFAIGLAALAASAGFGALWDAANATVAFSAFGALACVAVLVLWWQKDSLSIASP